MLLKNESILKCLLYIPWKVGVHFLLLTLEVERALSGNTYWPSRTVW